MDKDITTEQKILDAAKKVFYREGLSGARMKEIADEAGINHALLHYYFRTKEKLFDKIFEEAVSILKEGVFIITESDQPVEVKIQEFVDKYLSFMIENPYLPLFIITQMNLNPDKIINFLSIKRNMNSIKIKNQLEQKLENSELRPFDYRQLMINLMSLLVFPFIAKPMFKDAFDMNDDAYIDFLNERKKIIPEIIFSWLKNKPE
jgi:AcrR family transcriptional regulator